MPENNISEAIQILFLAGYETIKSKFAPFLIFPFYLFFNRFSDWTFFGILPTT